VSDFPEITTEQIVARLRMIVAEPDSLCKTDLHYIEDAADELDSKGNEVARLTAERDEARRRICEMEAECIVFPPCSPQQYAVRMDWDCFKEAVDG
jgi:hypothetical protein